MKPDQLSAFLHQRTRMLRRLASRQSVFDHPAPGKELGFTGQGTILNHGFASFTVVLATYNIARQFNKQMHIQSIIDSIHADLLLDLIEFRSWHLDQLVGQPHTTDIGPGNLERHGHAALVHQQVDFAATFAAIQRTAAGWLLVHTRAKDSTSFRCLETAVECPDAGHRSVPINSITFRKMPTAGTLESVDAACCRIRPTSPGAPLSTIPAYEVMGTTACDKSAHG